MRIDHPENWSVFEGQESASVTIAPKAGAAGGTVVYGAVIQVVKVPKGKSAEQLTAQSRRALKPATAT